MAPVNHPSMPRFSKNPAAVLQTACRHAAERLLRYGEFAPASVVIVRSRLLGWSGLQAQRLTLSQSVCKALAVLGALLQRRVVLEQEMAQAPKHQHGYQQADPYPEQLGK